MQSNQNEDKPLSWTVDELFMVLHEHILVVMLVNIPREISIESSTKEMKLGMVLGEFYKYLTYLYVTYHMFHASFNEAFK